jgi:ActR/RegA family two-component response regulator
MQLTEILIIGTNEPIMQTIARLIDRDGVWKATIAWSFKEACETCLTKNFKLALIGAGLTDEEELRLTVFLSKTLPTLPIVKHYGGGSGLLFAEIHEGLR